MAKNDKGGRRAAGRAKGSGCLEKHGRTWRATWVVDGKRYTKSTGTADRREAEKKLAEFIAPYRLKSEAKAEEAAAKVAGRAGLDTTANVIAARAQRKRAEAGRLSVPLSKAWERFDTSPRREPVCEKLNRIYEARFSAFVAWVKEKRPDIVGLADVDTEAAEGFMRHLRAKVAPKTYNDNRALLVQVWKLLGKDAGLDGRNPWQEIKPLPKDQHDRRALTAEELARVVEPLTGEMRLLFGFGCFTGARLGDCALMRWESIDMRNGVILMTPHKTRKHGTQVRIPMVPVLRRMLEETPEMQRRGYVLPELAAEYQAHPSYVSERVQKVFRGAGIQTTSDTGRANPKNKKTIRQGVDVGFHSLRHSFVSFCGNAGVSLDIVRRLVGHTADRMTNAYFHTSDDAMRGAVAALPDVFSQKALPAHKDVLDIEAEVVPTPSPSDAPQRILEALEGMTTKNWKHVRDEIVRLVKGMMEEATR